MSYIKEKVAYLRGLSDGLEIKDEANAKLFGAIIEALDAIADTVEENEASIAELDECVDDLYDALDEIEDEVECGCGCCDDEDEEFDEDDFVEVECPHCGETIYFDQEMLASEDTLICPNCNQDVITAFDEEEEGDEE